MPTLFSAPEPLEGKVGVNLLVADNSGNLGNNTLNGIYVGNISQLRDLPPISRNNTLPFTPDKPTTMDGINSDSVTGGGIAGGGGAPANNEATDTASQWSMKEKLGVGALVVVLGYLIYREVRA